MERTIVLTWLAPEQSVKSESVSDFIASDYVNALLSGLMSMVQISTQNDYKFKDYELMHKIKDILDTGYPVDSDLNLALYIKIDFDAGWVNISFPREQGYLSIEHSIHIVSLAVYRFIVQSADPIKARKKINESIYSAFTNTDYINIEVEDAFLNK